MTNEIMNNSIKTRMFLFLLFQIVLKNRRIITHLLSDKEQVSSLKVLQPADNLIADQI
jgi:hypothetical protein